jgi:nucleoside-diphosphate-sugar epimerase
MQDTIFIFGSNGQIGTVLTKALRDKHGQNAVYTSDIREPKTKDGQFMIVDVTDRDRVFEVLRETRPTRVYHLAAILSANGEKNPSLTWKVNMQGLLNVLDACLEYKVDRVFFPSTVAVFGKTTPRQNTPQACALLPETVYGMSKVAGENWCNYYYKRYGLDVRSLRYPGVIGYQSIPEGGTTDYAVEIFHGALKEGTYSSFLEAATRLPMVYMPDAIRATLELMDADPSRLTVRYSYNLTGMSFTPAEIAQEIKNHLPDFSITYAPDFRQDIAASWTETIDDSAAREDWNWKPEYDLAAMTTDMIENIKKIYF